MRRRGATLVELILGMSITVVVVLASAELLLSGLKSYNRTTVEVGLNNQNAQGLRRVSQSLREALAVTVSADGRRIDYTLPQRSAANNPVTGEREFIDPPVSDGVARHYVVNMTNGTLVDGVTGRVLVRNIVARDPQVGSSQFNQNYAPFQLTTIGSLRAVSINLITLDKANGKDRYARMKTAAVVRNAQ
jgi:hypothetical protein